MVDGPVGLAHRRLAIVDVDAGRQPMCNEDGSVFVVHNGEIYNHAAASAGTRGARPPLSDAVRHRDDPARLRGRGTNAVERLHGMFAFAIWDRSHRRLLLARDRLGIKPLYYACTDTELMFASEIKAVLAAGSIRPAFNEHVLPEFLATRFVSAEETFFRGDPEAAAGTRPVLVAGRRDSARAATGSCRSRPVGPRRRIRVGGRRAPGPTRVGGAQPSDERRAARRVPVGRSRLERAGRAGGASGRTSRSEPSRSASRIARPTSWSTRGWRPRSIGAEHREVVVTPEQYFNALPDLVWHEDEPIAFPSSVPLYFVSRLAREHVKVVLTGEGADELFLGYNRYRVTFWNARLGQRVLGDCAAAPAPARAGSRRDAARVHRALRAPRLHRARAGHPRSVSRELRGVSRGAAAAGSWRPVSRSAARPVRRPGALLRGRRRAPCSSA